MVYLIHFDEPFRHASHYCGFTDDIVARIFRHEQGRGSRLLEHVTKAGIGWRIVRVWEGDRKFERMLKRRNNSKLICPECSGAQALQRAKS